MDIEMLKKDLDKDQFAAVSAPMGNILCIANAGSGKTRVLTYRIANQIDNGEPESSFIMLTFTVKAANEMMTRIKDLLGKDKLGILGGTFHSVALRFIRRAPQLAGLDDRPTVLDEKDSGDILGVVRELYCADQDIERKRFWQHKQIVEVGTFFPSSQLCSCCGHKNPDVKDLAVRVWVCPACGARHDRDVNAAINILMEGLRLLGMLAA